MRHGVRESRARRVNHVYGGSLWVVLKLVEHHPVGLH